MRAPDASVGGVLQPARAGRARCRGRARDRDRRRHRCRPPRTGGPGVCRRDAWVDQDDRAAEVRVPDRACRRPSRPTTSRSRHRRRRRLGGRCTAFGCDRPLHPGRARSRVLEPRELAGGAVRVDDVDVAVPVEIDDVEPPLLRVKGGGATTPVVHVEPSPVDVAERRQDVPWLRDEVHIGVAVDVRGPRSVFDHRRCPSHHVARPGGRAAQVAVPGDPRVDRRGHVHGGERIAIAVAVEVRRAQRHTLAEPGAGGDVGLGHEAGGLVDRLVADTRRSRCRRRTRTRRPGRRRRRRPPPRLDRPRARSSRSSARSTRSRRRRRSRTRPRVPLPVTFPWGARTSTSPSRSRSDTVTLRACAAGVAMVRAVHVAPCPSMFSNQNSGRSSCGETTASTSPSPSTSAARRSRTPLPGGSRSCASPRRRRRRRRSRTRRPCRSLAEEAMTSRSPSRSTSAALTATANQTPVAMVRWTQERPLPAVFSYQKSASVVPTRARRRPGRRRDRRPRESRYGIRR